MSIIRPELPSDHYTMIPNEWLRDNRLTYSARGLLADLMSNKPGWTVTLESLAKNGPHGLSAIRRMVGELETVGYLKRVRTHDGAGRFGESDYVICAPIDHDGETPSVDKSHIGSDKHKHSITPSGDQYAETPSLDNTISGVSVGHKKTIQLEDYVEEEQVHEDCLADAKPPTTELVKDDNIIGTAGEVVRVHRLPESQTSANGSRITIPFPVSDGMVAWANEHCGPLDIQLETDRFIDYWRAKAGANGRKTDWEATWRNWLRKASEGYGGRNSPAQYVPGSRQSVETRRLLDGQRLIDKYNAEDRMALEGTK